MRRLIGLLLVVFLCSAARTPPTQLTVFWAEGCPHCEEARPFVASLALEEPDLAIEWVEVRRSPSGRRRFLATVERLGLSGAGVPLFVVGDRAVVGFQAGVTESQVRAAVRAAPAGSPAIVLPLFGRVDPSRLSWPLFTVLIGLADGINPCAFYVLIVLCGMLLHVHARRRVLVYGGAFVLISGVVYFLFMTAWLNAFLVVGLSRAATLVLGALLVLMGLINLKELVWWKRGVSLMIPQRSKPRLFRRMREIASAANAPMALAGIVALAFVVNLVELGCTLGLPAVYTRLLSALDNVSPAGRYGWLALYNLAYVVPLALIVAIYAATLHRLVLSQQSAKILKLVSGVLLVAFGAVFLAAPDMLR